MRSTLRYPGCPGAGRGALELPSGTATTGTLSAVPTNDSLPVNDVPATGTGTGSTLALIGLDVAFDDDPGPVESSGPAWFAEQALTATATPSSTTNTVRDETSLVT